MRKEDFPKSMGWIIQPSTPQNLLEQGKAVSSEAVSPEADEYLRHPSEVWQLHAMEQGNIF